MTIIITPGNICTKMNENIIAFLPLKLNLEKPYPAGMAIDNPRIVVPTDTIIEFLTQIGKSPEEKMLLKCSPDQSLILNGSDKDKELPEESEVSNIHHTGTTIKLHKIIKKVCERYF